MTKQERNVFRFTEQGHQSPLGFEQGTRQLGLADNRTQRTDLQLGVIWNRDGNSGSLDSLLHHDVASALTNFDKTMTRENLTNFSA